MSDADPPTGHGEMAPGENADDGYVVRLDPRIRAIARAIGRQIAREQVRSGSAINDNAAHPVN